MIKAGELQKLRDAELAKAKAILTAAETANEGRGRDLSAEEDTAHQAHMAEVEALNKRMKRAMQMDAWEGTNRSVPPEPVNCPTPQERGVETVPATPKRWTSLKSFTGPDADERAYRFSRFVFAAAGRHEQSVRWLRERGMELRVHKESVSTSGGYLVPEQIDADMVKLIEQYGVFRQRARVVPMTSDVCTRSRRAGGLTAYLVGEGSQITESTMTFDQLTLAAKKWGVISTITSELNEDSAISMADTLAGEMAYAFAKKEDECGFVGDGTSTYGGVVGAAKALENLGTQSNTAGIYVASSATYASMTMADFAGVIGLLPQYADTPNTAWYCSSLMWGHMNRLAVAGGGNAIEDFAGKLSKQFLGYPVVITQALPRVSAATTVTVLFGDLRLAADFGDRRSMTVSFSEHATVGSTSVFDTDEIAVRATERFDINVHDVGNNSATAGLRQPGPIVGLATP